MKNILINKTYKYLIVDIHYFTKDVINSFCNLFIKENIYPNRFFRIEFEALLINESTEKVIINKTFLHASQFKYLSKELYNSLEKEYYDNTKNDENLNILFKYKFIV